MAAALDAQLDPALVGWQRIALLAENALREACDPLENMLGDCGEMPLFVGLPELRPGFTEQDAEQVQGALRSIGHLPVELRRTDIFARGHAAGVCALLAGLQSLRRGECEMCLVGGVDSYFHPDTMEWLDANLQLAGAVSRSGFVPGEGAAFCLLANEAACARWNLHPHARVLEAALAMEEKLIKTSDVCLGVGLTRAVQSALAGPNAASRPIDSIYCDINGERYRSEEWGFVALRTGRWFTDPSSYVSPAERWGDMGAASGPLFAMLASNAFARGAAKAARSLLWASSEHGLRGAVLLGRVTDH
jgi:3-oxoacyl-[acyl-carrier-protein] synthase-1